MPSADATEPDPGALRETTGNADAGVRLMGHGPILATTAGSVRGHRDGEVWAFLGIPYAAAPTGARRFRPPEPPPPWRDERDASGSVPSRCSRTTPGPRCCRGSTTSTGFRRGLPEPQRHGARHDGELRPVLVWIHGGASSSAPVGRALRRDLVRRAPTSSSSPSTTASVRSDSLQLVRPAPGYEAGRKRGLLDQIAALRWVQDNIAAFGGDPGRVTVIGRVRWRDLDRAPVRDARRARPVRARDPAERRAGANWSSPRSAATTGPWPSAARSAASPSRSTSTRCARHPRTQSSPPMRRCSPSRRSAVPAGARCR